MAIYHCKCTVISRNNIRSSVGASAYISGGKIKNEHDGLVHDYTRKSGVLFNEIMLPENAPEEWQDRNKLWNEVERTEKSNDSRLAREYEIGLPRELTKEQQIELAKTIAQKYFISEGMCVDLSMHDKKDGNPHTHIMTTLRPIDENGQWENKTEKLYLCKNAKGEERAFTSKELLGENSEWKKQYHYSKNGEQKGKKIYLTEQEKEGNPKYANYERIKGDKHPKSEKFGKQNPKVERWNSEEFLQNIRAGISHEINLSLEQNGHEERVDHRSYKEQGIEQIPTIHLGVSANQMEKRGIKTDRGNINREIRSKNEEIKRLNSQIKEITISRIGVQTDIQIQNVHNVIQSYKGQIPQATKEQLESIKKSLNILDKKMEKIKDSGAYKGKEIITSIDGSTHIPKMEYEYKKYKMECSEIGKMTEERTSELLKDNNKNIKEIETKEPQETPQRDLHKELETIQKEYTEVTSRLKESEKIENTPRVTNEYSVAYNNADRCLNEIKKNQAIFDKARGEKGNLNLLQRAERKNCDSTMQKATENINKQMETMNKLGIKDLSQAPAKMKEFALNDRKEKQTLATFNQTKADLQAKAGELENKYTEIKRSLPPQEQLKVAVLKSNKYEQKAENKEQTQGMSGWKKEMQGSQALDKLRDFEKSVGKSMEEKLQEQEQNKTQENERTR